MQKNQQHTARDAVLPIITVMIIFDDVFYDCVDDMSRIGYRIGDVLGDIGLLSTE